MDGRVVYKDVIENYYKETNAGGSMMIRYLHRREAMGLMVAVPFAATLGSTSRAHAQESEEDDGTVDYLFVQTAHGVRVQDRSRP